MRGHIDASLRECLQIKNSSSWIQTGTARPPSPWVKLILTPCLCSQVSGKPLPCFFRLAEIRAGFTGGTVVKNLPADARDTEDMGSVPGRGRSPGEGHGNPLQCPCLENPLDRRAWHRVGHD